MVTWNGEKSFEMKLEVPYGLLLRLVDMGYFENVLQKTNPC